MDGWLDMGQDKWMVQAAPIVIAEQQDMPFNIEIKYYQSAVDNSGSEGPQATSDPTEGWVITSTFGGMVAPCANADETAIIKYEVTP